MQPITFNNQPPQPAADPLPNGGSGSDGSPINFPEGIDESFITRYCKTRNASFHSWFNPFISKIKELHRQAKNLPTGKTAGKNANPLPIAYGVVESINARLAAILLNRPKIVEAVPEYASQDNTEARKIEDFVNQTVLEVTRQPEAGKSAIKAAIIESFFIWRNVWKQEIVKTATPNYVPDPMWTPNPMDPMAEPPMVYQGDTIQDELRSYWTWELENPANMAWDGHTTTRIQDSPWVRKRSKMSYNQLLRWQKEGRITGVERLKFVIPEAASGATRDDWESEIRAASGDPNWNFSYADEKLYTIEEWWADLTYNVNGQTQQGRYRWFVVEGQFVLSFEENPLIPQRHPWGSCPFIIDPHNLTGLSPLDAVKGIQEQINTMAGYQADLTNRAANPTIFYDSTSGLTARASFMRMGGLQPVENVQGIKEFITDSSPLVAVQNYINFLIQLAREATGANEQFQGTEGADTATEFQGLMAAAGSRFADISDTLSQGWLEALARECFLFYKQFGEDGQMVVRNATTEGQADLLTKQDFQGEYAFVAASGANEQAKTAEINRVVQVLELTAKMPPSADGRVFNVEKAVREILLPALGQKNGADWFTMPAMPPMGMGAPGMPPPDMQGGGLSPEGMGEAPMEAMA